MKALYNGLQILLAITLMTTFCHGETINMTEYERMPALYKFDNYNECINRKSAVKANYPAKYCMIFVEIQPDNNSLLWKQIDEFTKATKFRYRHDHLFRGLCLENCRPLKEYNESSTTNVDENLINNEEKDLFSIVHKTSLDHHIRQRYHSDIHQCINKEYQDNYNLSTKTFIQYCIDPEIRREYDIYFYITVLLIILLALLCVLSSIYDAKLKSTQMNPKEGATYYKTQHTVKIHRYLTAFSLIRNFNRLLEVKKSDIGMDLSFLDGLRALFSSLVIIEHSFLIMFCSLKNPDFFEIAYTQLWLKSFLTGFVWLELFFVLSGILLYVKFFNTQYITPKSSFRDCVNVYIRLMVSRYLRFFPSLIFIIMFTGNVLIYNQHGPFTRFLVDAICWECRDNWWYSLLMVNNYYLKRGCLIHTWYIAADFQLHAFFLIILIIAAKYPKTQTSLFAGTAILAAAINVLLNYFLKLEPFFTVQPQFLRYWYMDKIESGKHLYFSSYTNINPYLVGIIFGFIYMKYLRKNDKNKRKLGNILKVTPYVGLPIVFAISYLGTQIVHYQTSIWTAMYCLLQRHVAISLVAVIIMLKNMCTRESFLNFAPLRFLARISFQVYLWHLVVFLYLATYNDGPVHVSYLSIVLVSAVLLIASNVVAFVTALLVEYPFAELLSIIDIENNRKIKSTKNK